MLLTAVQSNGYPGEGLYASHVDHPLTRWATDSLANWERLYAYTEAALEEWCYRWDHGPGETHRSWETVLTLDREAVASLDWPSEAVSEPPPVTGEWTADGVVDAYRLYYANERRHRFEWSKDREAPPWVEEYAVDRER